MYCTVCTTEPPNKDKIPFCADFVNFTIDSSTNVTFIDEIIKSHYKIQLVLTGVNYSESCDTQLRAILCWRTNFFGRCNEGVVSPTCWDFCESFIDEGCVTWNPNANCNPPDFSNNTYCATYVNFDYPDVTNPTLNSFATNIFPNFVFIFLFFLFFNI